MEESADNMIVSFGAVHQLNVLKSLQNIPDQSLSCISNDDTNAIFFDFDKSNFLSVDLQSGCRTAEWSGRMYKNLQGAKTVSKMHAIAQSSGETIVLMFGFEKRSERFFVASYRLEDATEKSVLIDEHLLSVANPSYRRQQTSWQEMDGSIFFVIEWYSYQPDKTWFSVLKVTVDDIGHVTSNLLFNSQHIDFHSEQSFKFVTNDSLHIFTEWTGGMPSQLLRLPLLSEDKECNKYIAITVDDNLSKLQKLEKRWQCVPQIVCGQTIFYVRSREEKSGEFWTLSWSDDGEAVKWIYHGEFAKTVQSWNLLACQDGSIWLHSNKAENGSAALFQEIHLQLPKMTSPDSVKSPKSPTKLMSLPSPSPLREKQVQPPSKLQIARPTIIATPPTQQVLKIVQSVVNLPERSLPCLSTDGKTAVFYDFNERSFVTIDLASGYRTGEFKDQPYKQLEGGKIVLDTLHARAKNANEMIAFKFGFERLREKFFVASYQLDYNTLTTTLLHEHLLPVDNPSYRRHQTLHQDSNNDLFFVVEWYSYQPDKTWFHVISIHLDDSGQIKSNLKMNAQHVDFHTGQAFKFVTNNCLHILTTWYAGMPTKVLRLSLDGKKREEIDIITKDTSALTEKRWKCIPQTLNNQILFYMHSEKDKIAEIWSLQFTGTVEAEWTLQGQLKGVHPKNILVSKDEALWLHRDQDAVAASATEQAYLHKIYLTPKANISQSQTASLLSPVFDTPPPTPKQQKPLLSPAFDAPPPTPKQQKPLLSPVFDTPPPIPKQQKPTVPPRKISRPTVSPPPPPVPMHSQQIQQQTTNSTPKKKISLPEDVKCEGAPINVLEDLRQRLNKRFENRKSEP